MLRLSSLLLLAFAFTIVAVSGVAVSGCTDTTPPAWDASSAPDQAPPADKGPTPDKEPPADEGAEDDATPPDDTGADQAPPGDQGADGPDAT